MSNTQGPPAQTKMVAVQVQGAVRSRISPAVLLERGNFYFNNTNYPYRNALKFVPRCWLQVAARSHHEVYSTTAREKRSAIQQQLRDHYMVIERQSRVTPADQALMERLGEELRAVGVKDREDSTRITAMYGEGFKRRDVGMIEQARELRLANGLPLTLQLAESIRRQCIEIDVSVSERLTTDTYLTYEAFFHSLLGVGFAQTETETEAGILIDHDLSFFLPEARAVLCAEFASQAQVMLLQTRWTSYSGYSMWPELEWIAHQIAGTLAQLGTYYDQNVHRGLVAAFAIPLQYIENSLGAVREYDHEQIDALRGIINVLRCCLLLQPQGAQSALVGYNLDDDSVRHAFHHSLLTMWLASRYVIEWTPEMGVPHEDELEENEAG